MSAAAILQRSVRRFMGLSQLLLLKQPGEFGVKSMENERASTITRSSNNPAVIMLVSNPFDPDPRVLREARSLVENGIPVEVIGWDRLGTSREREMVGGIVVHRIRVSGGYSEAAVVASTLPLFWISAFATLLGRRIKVVHCHDFDTLPVGVALRTLKGCAVVFDAHEFYPSYVRDKVPHIAYLAIKVLHTVLYRKVDVVFTVSDNQKSLFRHSRVEVIPNLPQAGQEGMRKKRDSRTRNNDDTFTIFYYGNLTSDRGIRQMLEIPRVLRSAKVVLAGHGPLEDLVISTSKRNPKVKYLGWITPAQIEETLASCDYVSILYDPQNMNNATGLPNKLFEALKFGAIPIVPEGTAMATLVQAEGFGLVVPYKEVARIADAVHKLEGDPEAKARTLEAGRDIFNQQYNWEVAESRLLSTYRQLISQRE